MKRLGTVFHGRRSTRKALRVLALIGFCAVSWGASASLIAAPVAASTCLPYGSTCSPDDFTGGAAGTLLADTVETLSFPGVFSGSYTEAVYQNSGGTLDFYLQVQVDSVSANGLTQVSASDFQDVTADMGYRSDGSTLSGGVFVDGSQIPSGVTRDTTGNPVAWDFSGPDAVNTLPPGDESMVLEVKTDATTYTAGNVFFTGGGDHATGTGLGPHVTPISSTASPSAAHTGATLQDSATLAATSTPDGTGSVTFNLYAPGDTTCSSTIHAETVSDITSDGPWTTATGYVPTTPGTYQWVASFSGDTGNPAGTTGCGDEPVVVARAIQITPASTTCSQFAGDTSSALSSAAYSVAHGKISAVAPSGFTYWAAVTSTGGTQTYHITQFTNETSRPFLLGSGSQVLTSGCTSVAAAVSQFGGAVTVQFNGGSAGQTFFVDLNFSTSHVVGESKPAPNGTVRYLFKFGFSTREFDLVK